MEVSELSRPAGRLIGFGLRPRLSPTSDAEYRELLARYRTDSRFQQIVDQFADGLDLQVVHASALGFYLAARPGSRFAYTLEDFRQERGLSDTHTLNVRGLYAIITVGIAAYFYPQAQHLAEERHPAATAAQIDRFIRVACEELRAKLGSVDPSVESIEREPAWQYYLRQKETSQGSDGRRGQQGTLPAIQKLLDLFVEHQLVRQSREGGDRGIPHYQPLERFRYQVAEFAGAELFEQLSQIRLAQLSTGRS